MTNQQTNERWGIVGGGILGMTLALRMAEAGRKVTLFEAAPEVGGLASAWQLEDIVWDKHYHVTLMSDGYLRNILRELGLDEDMKWVETKTGFYTDGKLYSMSNSLEFLKFPPLGLIDKFRLGGTIWYASKLKNWKKLERIPVQDWLRKLSGKRTFEQMWAPLLRAKLGDQHDRVSASFIWAIIARMYAARRSGLKKEMFGYLPGGYGPMLERFAEHLREKGVDIRTNAPVKNIAAKDGAIQIDFPEGESETFDKVALTIPCPLIPRLVPDLNENEVSRLNSVTYQGIICASVLLKKPLDKYYVTNITDEVPFTAVIEMTNLVDPAAFKGRHLVYLPKYVSPDSPAFDESDESLRASFVGTLLKMYPHLSEDDVLAFQVSRVRNVLALATLNYSTSLPPKQSSIPHLYFANSAYIFNGTLNVNETIQLAEDSAREFLS
jgi:protoporphyrinogen oxidase